MPNTNSLLKIVLLFASDRHCMQRHLGFIHPTTKKEMFFETELPDDMRAGD